MGGEGRTSLDCTCCGCDTVGRCTAHTPFRAELRLCNPAKSPKITFLKHQVVSWVVVGVWRALKSQSANLDSSMHGDGQRRRVLWQATQQATMHAVDRRRLIPADICTVGR